MQRISTRQSYAARLDRVLEHMTQRLDQPLSLEQLAAIGHFSPYHFHRIYRGLMGETVVDTLRRMRLHRAAVELLQGTRTLGSIARYCGYGSAAAFNRAFAQTYGLPPGEFRRRRGLGLCLLPPIAAIDIDLNAQDVPTMYEVKITQLAPVGVAALAHHGAYHDIGATFEKLAAWAAAHRVPPTNRNFGLYYDDPESKPAQELRSDACVEVPSDLQVDGAVRRLEIAGGRYAVLIHTGPYAELERPYRWLFGEWLPASGEEAADAPVVEEYLNDPHSLPPAQWQTAICVPLRGAGA
jgi:AraC family transcriptional regulator